jgi:hypothetical protein
MKTSGDQAMHMIRAFVLGAMALTVGTAASAETPTLPSTGQTTAAPSLLENSQRSEQQSRPLFTIGGVEVHLWAPVEQPYDSHMNRTAAANPMWESGE